MVLSRHTSPVTDTAIALAFSRISERSASFRRALSDGLKNPYDVAMANKHLAFIACAYNRPAECENAFRAAFAADPAFRLSEAEVGHPLWGPVYKRVAAEEAAKASPAR